ncbi:MAG: sensor histidine kinase YesM [Myxococcota bacterium]|jgi:sensor histidine kinase YesM
MDATARHDHVEDHVEDHRMTQAWASVVSAALGVLVALGALAVLHQDVLPLQALLVGGFAVLAQNVVRLPWRHLPVYVSVWLDLGVVVATALLAAVAHALTYGVPYMVLRLPELSTLFVGSLVLGVTVGGMAYTHLRLATEVDEQGRRVAELERSSLESRLSALSAQINPHFLFNTLNTLAQVVHEDEDAAEDLVTDLSAMMRMALRSSARRVPLLEELDLVRRLFRIEASRLGERLTWSIEGVQTLDGMEVPVPGLLVQPLVENAIKYAVADRVNGGSVQVEVTVENGFVRVRIDDDGPGLPVDVAKELAAGSLRKRGTEGAGGGLRNCMERLRLAWPNGDANLCCEGGPPGTRLILTLPVEST